MLATSQDIRRIFHTLPGGEALYYARLARQRIDAYERAACVKFFSLGVATRANMRRIHGSELRAAMALFAK